MVKILVVEDDEMLRSTIIDVLDSASEYQIFSAANGRVGLELAQAHQPNLIICDIEMPEMNGYEMLQALRKNEDTATIPFIFLTALSDRSSTRAGMELGADDYIAKPFTAVELLNAIQTRFEKLNLISDKYEKQMDDLRGNILLALPHELRTPLGIIIGFSDLLLEDSETLPRNEITNYARSINDAGRRLHHLVENYLIYAQLEILVQSGQFRQLREIREAQPDSIIRNVITKLTHRQPRQVETYLDTAEVELLMTHIYFEKIVDELVSNALKFSFPETAVIVKTAVENQTFQLTIQNQGRGMTAEQIRNIGPYMQFERRIYEQQGSGFGLIIASRLTELHNGRLNIQSEPNKVTTVEVLLPI